MNINNPIITSILDNDLYTATVGQIAFKDFPSTIVRYKFINRGKTKFPPGFADKLNEQLALMANLSLSQIEYEWLDSLDYFSYDYLQYLRHYKFNPSELTVTQIDGELSVEFNGKWESLIMWEVPFLALVSEIFYKLTGAIKDDGWLDRITQKAQNLSRNKCLWVDFGTRRRFDFEAQQAVVFSMKSYVGFLGTSNMLLAYQNGIIPIGTMSHQLPMALSALYGVSHSNRMCMKHWIKCYGNKLNTYLPDTFTTDVFLRDFNKKDAERWNLRQDSGDPNKWMGKVLSHYDKLGMSTKDKTFVFSDGLTDEKYKQLSLKYRKYANIVGGIGTSISNDCGHPPLNIVVKLVAADFGDGFVDVVKLSDSPGKYTGNPEAIAQAKRELGLDK